jgi:anti-sigma B factor antagonist
MTISKTLSGNTLIVAIAGRLDTTTSAELSSELNGIYAGGVPDIVFDLKDLDYISSAGVGVLLGSAKRATASGKKAEITGAAGLVKEVLDMTGLSAIVRST